MMRAHASARAIQDDQAEVRKIESDRPIERPLGPPHGHLYEINLVKGQYLQIDITSAELWLSLNVLLNDRSLGGAGLVRPPTDLTVSLVVPETGSYRIAVSTNGQTPPSKYRLLVTLPSNPPPQFFVRAQAQQMEKVFNALYYEQPDKEAFLKMSEMGEDLARLFAQSGQAKGQADVLSLVGEAWRQLGEWTKAMDAFERSLRVSRAIGYHLKEAEVLTFIGMCRYQVSDYRRGIEAYREALPLWDVVIGEGNHTFNMVGWTLTQLGYAQLALGEMRKAIASFEESAGFYRRYHEAGASEEDWHFGAAFALRGIGRIQALAGEKQKAIDTLSQALEHFKGAKDNYYEPLLLNEVGEFYASLGEGEQALDLYERALKQEKRMGSRAPEAQTLYLIGRLGQAEGKLDEAEQRFNQSLEIRRELEDRRGQAAALSSLGEIQMARGEHRQAIPLFDEALAIQREIGDRYGEGVTLGNLGTAYAALDDAARARQLFDESLVLRRALGDREGEANALYHQARLVARLARDAGQLQDARDSIEASLKQTEWIRSSVFSQELRASYLSTVRDYYEFYIDLLMRLHEQRPAEKFDQTALQASEMARARSLLDALSEARVDIRSGVDANLLARERELQQRLSAKGEALLRLQRQRGTEERLAALNKEIQAITVEYREVLAHIRVASPHYAALTQPQSLAAAEIQKLLDGQTMLLEYSLGDERSFLWAITRESVTSYVLPPRAQINEASSRVYDLLIARNQRQPNEASAKRQAR
ncbi:MAG: tetratricopeptide repeat protein, partial [Acidobacteriota bacterium]